MDLKIVARAQVRDMGRDDAKRGRSTAEFISKLRNEKARQQRLKDERVRRRRRE